MCGITGTIGFQFQGNLKDIAYRMVDALNHRGPDANDIWLDEHLKVCLGHNRLSILDLSSARAQPLISHCQRYVLAFNGEIYNHLSMRAD